MRCDLTFLTARKIATIQVDFVELKFNASYQLMNYVFSAINIWSLVGLVYFFLLFSVLFFHCVLVFVPLFD